MTLQTQAPENFHLCRWGDERTVKRAQTVSEDPHLRKRKFVNIIEFSGNLLANAMDVQCVHSTQVEQWLQLLPGG